MNDTRGARRGDGGRSCALCEKSDVSVLNDVNDGPMSDPGVPGVTDLGRIGTHAGSNIFQSIGYDNSR